MRFIARLNVQARVALCGLISGYNSPEPSPGPKSFSNLLIKRTTLQGFTQGDHVGQMPQASVEIGGLIAAGRLTPLETVVDGFDQLPTASTSDHRAAIPVLLFSGGVDTFKMDVHHWCITLAQHTGATVLAFDMPGTGENPVPLGPDSDALVQALVTAARGIGNGLVGHLGISFGGNFSALTGLTGTVDAAIVLGGPVDGAFRPENLRRLPYGMADIVGNAMGFDHPVTVEELSARARR